MTGRNVNKIDHYKKFQQFLEDIYIYLNNNVTKSHGEIEHQRLKEELIENCKHIRRIFEADFHPHDDVESSSYLDMNGAGMNRNHGLLHNKKHENESLKEDYIDMTKRDLLENTYNVYETTSSLNNENSEQCPFTGLPAAHLRIMNSAQCGLLTRIEKKLFFAQEKDFYVGILEKWILLYPSKSNDMKPSACFYPKSITIEKGENQFNVETNLMKRYHFQAPNTDEFNDWVQNIRRIIEYDQTKNLKQRETQTSHMSFRKLPSPPLGFHEGAFDSSSENYYGFNRNSNQTVINNEERFYEEPISSSSLVEDLNTENSEKKVQRPSLPQKMGKKQKDDELHSYDIPKRAESILDLDDKIELQDCPRSFSFEPSSPSKFGTRVSEMTAILSSINLVSPEEKRKSSHNLNSKKIATTDKTASDNRISPVKNWFAKYIGKSKKRLSKQEQTPEGEEENSDLSSSIKGAKVNLIINQLEKNGQLKVLSKSLKNRKSLALKEGKDNEIVVSQTKGY